MEGDEIVSQDYSAILLFVHKVEIERTEVTFFQKDHPRPLLLFIFGLFKQTSLQFLQQ